MSKVKVLVPITDPMQIKVGTVVENKQGQYIMVLKIEETKNAQTLHYTVSAAIDKREIGETPQEIMACSSLKIPKWLFGQQDFMYEAFGIRRVTFK